VLKLAVRANAGRDKGPVLRPFLRRWKPRGGTSRERPSERDPTTLAMPPGRGSDREPFDRVRPWGHMLCATTKVSAGVQKARRYRGSFVPPSRSRICRFGNAGLADYGITRRSPRDDQPPSALESAAPADAAPRLLAPTTPAPCLPRSRSR